MAMFHLHWLHRVKSHDNWYLGVFFCFQSPTELTDGHKTLLSWLNKRLKIEMTDGRVLIGIK